LSIAKFPSLAVHISKKPVVWNVVVVRADIPPARSLPLCILDLFCLGVGKVPGIRKHDVLAAQHGELGILGLCVCWPPLAW